VNREGEKQRVKARFSLFQNLLKGGGKHQNETKYAKTE
jgi:hypothetical protein